MATKVDVGSRVRVLLLLWDGELRRGELFKRLRKKGEKSELYQAMLNQLVADGAISISAERYPVVTLLDTGRSLLRNDLLNDDFGFDTLLGVRLVNVLLSVMRSTIESVPIAVPMNTHDGNTKIRSYEEFKEVALNAFEKLNSTCNKDGLVPIWQLRNELQTSVEREEFNDWIMRMQADQLFYLQRGQAMGITNEQIQDSINDDVRGLLLFVSYPV